MPSNFELSECLDEGDLSFLRNDSEEARMQMRAPRGERLMRDSFGEYKTLRQDHDEGDLSLCGYPSMVFQSTLSDLTTSIDFDEHLEASDLLTTSHGTENKTRDCINKPMGYERNQSIGSIGKISNSSSDSSYTKKTGNSERNRVISRRVASLGTVSELSVSDDIFQINDAGEEETMGDTWNRWGFNLKDSPQLAPCSRTPSLGTWSTSKGDSLQINDGEEENLVDTRDRWGFALRDSPQLSPCLRTPSFGTCSASKDAPMGTTAETTNEHIVADDPRKTFWCGQIESSKPLHSNGTMISDMTGDTSLDYNKSGEIRDNPGFGYDTPMKVPTRQASYQL